MRSTYVAFVASLAIGTGACGILDSDTFAEPAVIIAIWETARVTAPDSVARGANFPVSVRTFGGGCTREIARTLWNVSGGLLQILPYNKTRRSDVCTLDALYLTHTVTTRIDQAGPATIRVIGVEHDLYGNRPAQLDRAIAVY